MQLYLIRHTTPAVPSGVCYGQSDVDVAATFFDEAEKVRHKIAHVTPVATYSSPLSRAAKLAASLKLGPARHDARLMELDFGAWEMQAWDDIPREQLDRWGNDYICIAPPGGETYVELHRRVMEVLQELRVRHAGETVVVVTHAGVIRALLAEVLGLPLTEVFRFHLDFAGITLLQFTEGLPSVGFVNR